jgi:hypothetical protein
MMAGCGRAVCDVDAVLKGGKEHQSRWVKVMRGCWEQEVGGGGGGGGRDAIMQQTRWGRINRIQLCCESLFGFDFVESRMPKKGV